jgi:NAD(P)-dependent dehydrogenase (short-subunit alcohol dehydrogenase family)
VVTGASGAIGGACADALAGSVERIVLVGRDKERLERAAAIHDGRATALVVDLTDDGAARAVAERVSATGGRLRWVVHAAGAALRRGLADATPEEIERTVRVNLLAPLLLLRELLALEWQRPAAIVAIGSLSATRPLPGRSVYGSAKAGLEQAMRGLAVELAPRGIGVNVVSPGVIDTAMIADVRDAVRDWADRHVPAGRLGEAAEVAAVVRFLCLDAPTYLTGTRIPVDGAAEVSG